MSAAAAHGVRVGAVPTTPSSSARIFDLAEVGFAETASVAAIVDALAARGIEADVGVHGLPTAW